MRFFTVLPVLIGLSLAFVSPVLAQRAPAVRKVPAHQTYERITAVVPFVGTGAKGDPKRPMFAPTPAEARRFAGGGGVAPGS